MGFNKRKVDFTGQYPSMYVLRYLPIAGTVVIIWFWTLLYWNSLWDQAIQMDSLIPIIDANQIDNLLIWMFSTSALSIMVYLLLIPVTQRFHISQTIPSEIDDLLESAISKMNMNFRVDLRVNRESGIVFAGFRNLFYASIVISNEAQTLILKEKELGEVIIAHTLCLMKNAQPFSMVLMGSIGAVLSLEMLPDPSPRAVGLYELINLKGMRLMILIVLSVITLIFCYLSDFKTSEFNMDLITSKYHLSPVLARMALFEGIAIRRSDIEVNPNLDNSNDEASMANAHD